jgi:RES domain-containing protein
LELIVHRANKRKDTYKTMVISLAEDPMLFMTFERKQLPHNWRSFLAEERLREMGSVWYRDQRTPILRVPSIIIPQEYNYVLNTAHPLFSEVVELTEVENFFWDKRL